MVEAAILFPFMAALVFGICQFGFMLAGYISLKNASAAGARAGIIFAGTPVAQLTPAAMRTAIAGAVATAIIPLDFARATIPPPSVTTDNPPKVGVTINYSLPLFPGSRFVTGTTGNFAMSGQTTMQ